MHQQYLYELLLFKLNHSLWKEDVCETHWNNNITHYLCQSTFIHKTGPSPSRAYCNREFKLLRVFRERQTAGSNFLRKIFVKRFRFIFSFLCQKNNYTLQF
jgi:hypothetical protein